MLRPPLLPQVRLQPVLHLQLLQLQLLQLLPPLLLQLPNATKLHQ
jgi:hypothetical protein